jgi:hypothetical protein
LSIQIRHLLEKDRSHGTTSKRGAEDLQDSPDFVNFNAHARLLGFDTPQITLAVRSSEEKVPESDTIAPKNFAARYLLKLGLQPS